MFLSFNSKIFWMGILFIEKCGKKEFISRFLSFIKNFGSRTVDSLVRAHTVKVYFWKQFYILKFCDRKAKNITICSLFQNCQSESSFKIEVWMAHNDQNLELLTGFGNLHIANIWNVVNIFALWTLTRLGNLLNVKT